MNNNKSLTTYILWFVFILLLGVLLPHTAWAFGNWEPKEGWNILGFELPSFTNWLAAIAFEGSIAVLVHKLSKRIEQPLRGKTQWQKFAYRYLNAFSFLLVGATGISILANLSHAVQFGGELLIFTEWGWDPKFFSVAFGASLPLMSLGFAAVLSEVTEDEEAPNPALVEANRAKDELRKQLRESEQQRKVSEERVKAAEEKARITEERLGAVTDLARALFGDDKRQRIIITRKQWPQLPNSSIAVIAQASPAYVSEVLSTESLVEA